VLRVGPAQRRRGGDIGSVPGGLIGAEIAAIAEDGQQIALLGLGELGVGTGRWPKVTGETCPMLNLFEDVEHVTLRHTRLQLLLELGESRCLLRLRELLEVRGAVGIDAEFDIVREPASTSAARVASSFFNAAAKSSPRSGMPRAAQ
jgi:hypothetical protein